MTTALSFALLNAASLVSLVAPSQEAPDAQQQLPAWLLHEYVLPSEQSFRFVALHTRWTHCKHGQHQGWAVGADLLVEQDHVWLPVLRLLRSLHCSRHADISEQRQNEPHTCDSHLVYFVG